jgi:N utilization substance protein A
MKGMRVQSIIRELRGEKIDIIEYSDDSVVFATHALSPAKISRVAIISAAEKHMEVIVDDTQLSLAIGKKGQNVRLAARLLGWKIDIKSEEEKRQEVESAMAQLVGPAAPVSVLMEFGLPQRMAERLIEGGVATVDALGSMTPEQIEEIPGIGPEAIQDIQAAVNGYYGQFEEPAPYDAGASLQSVEELPAEGAESWTAESDVAGGETPVAVETEPGTEADFGHMEPGEVVDAADAHLSVAPSTLDTTPAAERSAEDDESDRIEDQGQTGHE